MDDPDADPDVVGVAIPTPCHAGDDDAKQLPSVDVRRHPRHLEIALSDWTTLDYFNDESLNDDPYAYFDELRSECPVLLLPHLNVVAVTGYDEIQDVYRDTETFSSCNSVVGPYAMFPVPLEGDDVGDTIDQYRDQLPMHEHMVTMDPPSHTRERGLMMRLSPPSASSGTLTS